MAEQESLVMFAREHFIRINLDEYHYYYSFGVPGFEICLEPCAAGFDVAIYAADEEPEFRVTAEPKRCTETGHYTNIGGLFGDRKDEDWNKALEIADELLDKYIHDRQKLGELLSRLQKERMKCMFCGCTEDHACPDGCAWAAPNLCTRCIGRAKGNDLISGEEIIALRLRAKTITMKDGLKMTMKDGFVPVLPMEIKSGYGVSLTIIENSPESNKRGAWPSTQIEVFSVGSHGNPDPADSERIALAVLGEGYAHLESMSPSKKMVHFFKRRQ